MSRRTFWLVLLAVAVVTCVTSRVGQRVQPGQLQDGVYQGEYSSFPNFAQVEVTIERGRIVDIELKFHGGSWIGHRADAVIPRRILEEQSTRVDAVMGATNSSHVIMNAVEDALQKAQRARASDTQPTTTGADI